MKKAFRFIKTYFALLVIGSVFIWSVVVIGGYREGEAKPGTITLRIAHWQLEPGVHKGLDMMIEDYHKLHPDVIILQDAIPESTYPQWISTQLMGGTASDMMEVGLLDPAVLIAYMGRYFVPMTRYVSQPNPYNQGTDLADTPLRLTYKDGMRDSYVEELQDFMKMPLTQFGIRIYYNKDLFKKLTGLDQAPLEYRAFLEACKRIQSQKNERGEAYIPIIGSKYHFGMWDLMMFQPLTFGGLKKVDFNRDGTADSNETYIGFKTERVGLDYPPYEARLRMISEMSPYFQESYTGLNRDDGVFLFAQQRGVFIVTGLWDARGLQEQARGKFNLGVMEFPMPATDDPEFGQFMSGPRYERPGAAFLFGVTRTSKHPETAIDFLLFMASRKQNEKFNHIAGWLSPIKGATPDPSMAVFEPHLRGIYNGMDVNFGGQTGLKWTQLYSLFQIGQLSREELIRQFDEFFRTRGKVDFAERVKTWRRDAHRYEQLLAGMRATAMLAPADAADVAWMRYRVATVSRQLGYELSKNRLLSLLDAGPAPDAIGPYEYTPEALKAIREHIMAEEQEAR